MRVGRLLTKVRNEPDQDVRAGGAYAFRNRSGTRMEVVCVDAQGVWLCTRRLPLAARRGRGVRPDAGAVCVVVRRGRVAAVVTCHEFTVFPNP